MSKINKNKRVIILVYLKALKFLGKVCRLFRFQKAREISLYCYTHGGYPICTKKIDKCNQKKKQTNPTILFESKVWPLFDARWKKIISMVIKEIDIQQL